MMDAYPKFLKQAPVNLDGAVSSRACHGPQGWGPSARLPRLETGHIKTGLFPVDLAMLARAARRRRMQVVPHAAACRSREPCQHIMPLPDLNACGESSQGTLVLRAYRTPFNAARPQGPADPQASCPPIVTS